MTNVVTSPDFSSAFHPYTFHDTHAIYGLATPFDSSQAPVLDTPLGYSWRQAPAESYTNPDLFNVTPRPLREPNSTQSAPVIGDCEKSKTLSHDCSHPGCGKKFEKRFQLKYDQ
jgi:hypothetical protein